MSLARIARPMLWCRVLLFLMFTFMLLLLMCCIVLVLVLVDYKKDCVRTTCDCDLPWCLSASPPALPPEEGLRCEGSAALTAEAIVCVV